jgi:hypothetical protein
MCVIHSAYVGACSISVMPRRHSGGLAFAGQRRDRLSRRLRGGSIRFPLAGA